MLEEPSGHLSISLNSNMPSPHQVLASFSKNEENWTVLVLSHGCTLKGPKEIFFVNADASVSSRPTKSESLEGEPRNRMTAPQGILTSSQG